jgi:hypothetical protein
LINAPSESSSSAATSDQTAANPLGVEAINYREAVERAFAPPSNIDGCAAITDNVARASSLIRLDSGESLVNCVVSPLLELCMALSKAALTDEDDQAAAVKNIDNHVFFLPHRYPNPLEKLLTHFAKLFSLLCKTPAQSCPSIKVMLHEYLVRICHEYQSMELSTVWPNPFHNGVNSNSREPHTQQQQTLHVLLFLVTTLMQQDKSLRWETLHAGFYTFCRAIVEFYVSAAATHLPTGRPVYMHTV